MSEKTHEPVFWLWGLIMACGFLGYMTAREGFGVPLYASLGMLIAVAILEMRDAE